MIYLTVIFIIGLLIFIHELGHFMAARSMGLPIAIFSVGFGPPLWAVKKGATEFRLSWIPLGGYVLLDVEDEQAFFTLPLRKRVFFSLGGPAANFVLAWLGFMLILGLQATPAWWQLPWQALTQALGSTWQILQALPMIFTEPGKLSGMVGIVNQGAQLVEAGTMKAVIFTVMISLNLMVFNLLPIPGLDGGKLLLALLEKIHPGSLKLQLPLTIIGLVVILGLMIYATMMDIGKLLS